MHPIAAMQSGVPLHGIFFAGDGAGCIISAQSSGIVAEDISVGAGGIAAHATP